MNYKLNDLKMFADIADGIAVIINSENGIYFGLNGFGTEVFNNLLNGCSKEDIVCAVKKIAGCPADIEEKINTFISQLTAKEILIVDSEKSEAVSLNSKCAIEDNFQMALDEYADAQELLLADPIHEVKEEEGWKPEKSSLNPDSNDVARREAKLK